MERTIFDEMILCQTLQASCARETLCDEETSSSGNLLPLSCRPAVHVLHEVGQGRLFKGSLEVFVSAMQPFNRRTSNEGRGRKAKTGHVWVKEAHLRISLFRTSTYCFMSATSTGSLALRNENGDRGVPSSTYCPPGCKRPPTRRISKRASAYFKYSRVEPAWTSLLVIASKSLGGTLSRCLRSWSLKTMGA